MKVKEAINLMGEVFDSEKVIAQFILTSNDIKLHCIRNNLNVPSQKECDKILQSIDNDADTNSFMLFKRLDTYMKDNSLTKENQHDTQ